MRFIINIDDEKSISWWQCSRLLVDAFSLLTSISRKIEDIHL